MPIKENLDAWIGNYEYSESYAEIDGPPMFMDYSIEVYKGEKDYFANMEIMGQTTMASVEAKVYGDREWISFVFIGYADDNITGVYEKDDVLLSLRKDGNEIYTYWGKIEPMLYLQTKSGEVCFVQTTE